MVNWYRRLLTKLHLRKPKQTDIDFDYWGYSESRAIPKSIGEFWSFLNICDKIDPGSLKHYMDLDVKSRNTWINAQSLSQTELGNRSQKILSEIEMVEEYVKGWLPNAEIAIKQLENQIDMSQFLLRQYTKLKEDLQEKIDEAAKSAENTVRKSS